MNRIAGNRFKFVVIDQHHQHIGGGQRRVQFRQRTKSVQFFRQLTDIRFDDGVSPLCQRAILCAIPIAGLSRRSSIFGLKASPKQAIFTSLARLSVAASNL